MHAMKAVMNVLVVIVMARGFLMVVTTASQLLIQVRKTPILHREMV
jgi:hypothetical protein